MYVEHIWKRSKNILNVAEWKPITYGEIKEELGSLRLRGRYTWIYSSFEMVVWLSCRHNDDEKKYFTILLSHKGNYKLPNTSSYFTSTAVIVDKVMSCKPYVMYHVYIIFVFELRHDSQVLIIHFLFCLMCTWFLKHQYTNLGGL